MRLSRIPFENSRLLWVPLAVGGIMALSVPVGAQTGGEAGGNGQTVGGQGQTNSTAQATAPTTTLGAVSIPTSPNQVPTGSIPQPGAADGSPVFDLSRTVNFALASSAAVQAARRNIQIDTKRKDEVLAQGRPNFNGNVRITRYDQATKIAIGGGPPITVLYDHSEDLQSSITQRIDLFGQIRAAVNQAKLQELFDKFALTQLTNNRILQAKNAYYNVLRSQHQVQVAEAALKSARDQEAIARRLYEGQVGQKIDLLRASTLVAQSVQDLGTAQNNRDVNRANFNNLLGRPLTAPVEAVDVPGVTVGTDIPTAPAVVGAPVPQAAAPFAVAPGEIEGINIDESITQAQRQRPEILLNEVNVRSADVGIKLARAGQEISLAVSATGDYYPTTSFQTPRQRVGAITATITIPFYDGGLTRARIAEARLRTDNARVSLESARSDVAIDVRTAYLNLATAARQIAAANAALEQAAAARQLAQVRYEGQVGIYLEVSDAQTALVRAQNNQVDAVYSYLVSRAQFENALGAPTLAPPSAAMAPTTAPQTPKP